MLSALIAPFSTETFRHQYRDIPSSRRHSVISTETFRHQNRHPTAKRRFLYVCAEVPCAACLLPGYTALARVGGQLSFLVGFVVRRSSVVSSFVDLSFVDRWFIRRLLIVC